MTAGKYATVQHLLDDVQLLHDNCIEYNGVNSEYTVTAKAMLQSAISFVNARVTDSETKAADAPAKPRKRGSRKLSPADSHEIQASLTTDVKASSSGQTTQNQIPTTPASASGADIGQGSCAVSSELDCPKLLRA